MNYQIAWEETEQLTSGPFPMYVNLHLRKKVHFQESYFFKKIVILLKNNICQVRRLSQNLIILRKLFIVILIRTLSEIFE